MCGLVGYVGVSPMSSECKNSIDLSLLKHRGPDSQGFWHSKDKLVYFGHLRLSIIDLSVNGNQPMYLSNYGLTIIFNGEIYNYLELKAELTKFGYNFKTNTDTEVILFAYHKWGKKFLKKLNGMFCFAIYDHKIRKVYFARDRSGQKPLYYFYNGKSLYFSSELKGLSKIEKLPRKVDIVSLDEYLGFGFVSDHRCIFSGYNKLTPATLMIFDLKNGRLAFEKYWVPPNYKSSSSKLLEIEIIKKLEDLLDYSVAKHLIADVPVGVLLSGGLDSSIVTALASRHVNNLKTFNVSFPENTKFDESKYALKIAQFFNTDHHQFKVTQNSIDILPNLSWYFDEPIADSSIIPMAYISGEVSKHCKVALGGDGSDELFGGYEHYKRLLVLQKIACFIPKFVRSGISNITKNLMPLGFGNSNLRTWLMASGVDFECEVPRVGNLFDFSSRRSLLGEYNPNLVSENDIDRYENYKDQKMVSFAMLKDFQRYLPDDLLVKVDRASMMYSLEVRAPFLENNVLDFCFSSVPLNQKVSMNAKKIILKKLAKEILPTDYDFTRKQGFSVPLQSWFKKGPFKEMAYDILTSQNCTFNKKTVLKLLKGQDGKKNNSERIFSLLNFELWKKSHNVEA